VLIPWTLFLEFLTTFTVSPRTSFINPPYPPSDGRAFFFFSFSPGRGPRALSNPLAPLPGGALLFPKLTRSLCRLFFFSLFLSLHLCTGPPFPTPPCFRKLFPSRSEDLHIFGNKRREPFVPLSVQNPHDYITPYSLRVKAMHSCRCTSTTR